MNTPPIITRILKMLANTETQELSCNEVYALLEEYTELQASGQDASRYLPLVDKHLRMCDGCREEYEALLAMIVMQDVDSTDLA
ncbi:MAG: hypothetical protein U9R25_07335 [Chloroflexota bacterium]|nr:hypothetical protein [Chloroflexota bacterium]